MTFHETIQLPAEKNQLAILRRFIKEHAGRTPASELEVDDLILAVDEAATNIIVHGYKGGKGEFEVVLDYQPGQIVVVLRDQAPSFDPTTVPARDLQQPLLQRPIGGLGVQLIRLCVDEVTYSARPQGGNELRMVKYLKDQGGLE